MTAFTVGFMVEGLPIGGAAALVAPGTAAATEEHGLGVVPTAAGRRLFTGRAGWQVAVAPSVVVKL